MFTWLPRPGSEPACRSSVSGNGARVMDFSAGLECRAGRTVDPENKPGGNCFPMETSKLTFENTCTILQKKRSDAFGSTTQKGGFDR
jgi:hypothetical protein